MLSNFANDVSVFVPDNVRASGVQSGKKAVSRWFEPLFAQFSSPHLTVRRVAVANLCDIMGNNMVVNRWVVKVVNRRCWQGQNSSVAVTTLPRSKVAQVQDLVFDTGSKFRAARDEDQ